MSLNCNIYLYFHKKQQLLVRPYKTEVRYNGTRHTENLVPITTGTVSDQDDGLEQTGPIIVTVNVDVCMCKQY